MWCDIKQVVLSLFPFLITEHPNLHHYYDIPKRTAVLGGMQIMRYCDFSQSPIYARQIPPTNPPKYNYGRK
jgi:hypothetical protein